MANPFLKFAPRGAPAPVAEEEELAPPPPAPAPVVNEFASYAEPADSEPAMDNWQTQVRGKNIVFSAPRGSSTAQIRALAKKAGVPDPQNRSLKFMGENAEPERTVAQEEAADSPWTAALHHGVDFVAPIVDEVAAGVDAMFTDRTYRQNMRNLEERSELLSEENPWATNLGRAGGVVSTIPLAVGTKALQGANWLGTSLRTAAAGAPIGAVNAYLSNPIDDRWNGVGTAAGIGGLIGGILPGVTNVTGSLANRVDQRLGISDWVRRRIMGQSPEQSTMQGAVDVMAARIPQDPAAMRARVQEFRDTGHDPVLANAIDESGRGFVGAMARRPGPGRETATQAYDAARLSMPERIDRNMAEAIDRSTVGAPARTATQAELNRPLDDVVNDLRETRTAEIEAAMLPIRGDPVPFTPRMVEILDTADGRRAIARAMRTVTDKDTLDAMKRMPAMLKEIGKIDPRMPPKVRDQIIGEITKDGGLTVDIADRLARKFNALADAGDKDAARALKGFAREIRDEAKAASPGYTTAMEEYAKTSKTLDAVDVGGDFLATNKADEFANRAAKVDGTSPAPGVPSDQQRMMQGARREVQKAAGENIANAPSVARRIAVSPEQHVRNVATFGPINAEALEKTMAISERQLKDLAQVAPNTGSATAVRGADDAAAADMLQAAVHIKTGNWGQAAMNVLRSIGVRDNEAGEIVKMALDPKQVDTLIDMLEASYGKQTAAKISRAIALPAITGTSRTVAGGRQ
jgi:hypothetical protein